MPVSVEQNPHLFFYADTPSAACPQNSDKLYQHTSGAKMWVPDVGLDEDCLYLNVWAPARAPEERKRNLLAVMVWVFGGGFYNGASSLLVYDGKFLAGRQNVIVVSMNYRLGVFGFLYLGTEAVPGNMGLWDQRLALKWTKENIINFGGDPERITIFGESSGGVSVSAHLISPWSHYYFTNAIIQSGSVFGYWGLITAKAARTNTIKFVKLLNCPSRPTSAIVRCLMKQTTKQLLAMHDYIFDVDSYFSIPFPPVLDNHFFPYNNSQSFQELDLLKPSGSVMMGTVKNEGTYFLFYFFVRDEDFRNNRSDLNICDSSRFVGALRNVIDYRPVDKHLSDIVIDATVFEYAKSGKMNNADMYRDMLDRISSDRTFKCPTLEMARKIVDACRAGGCRRSSLHPSLILPLYLYEFQHRTEQLTWPEWLGAMHGYEIEYIFGIPFSVEFQETFYRFSDEERKVSDMMMQYWTNFARTGDPNIQPSGNHGMKADNHVLINWPTFDSDTEHYLVINQSGRLKLQSKPLERECRFWQKLYPSLIRKADELRQRKKTCDSMFDFGRYLQNAPHDQWNPSVSHL